jgi:hypothetical protein
MNPPCIEAAFCNSSVPFSPARTRTEGHAPVWGSEFTTKAATIQGDSADFVPGLNRKFVRLAACLRAAWWSPTPSAKFSSFLAYRGEMWSLNAAWRVSRAAFSKKTPPQKGRLPRVTQSAWTTPQSVKEMTWPRTLLHRDVTGLRYSARERALLRVLCSRGGTQRFVEAPGLARCASCFM